MIIVRDISDLEDVRLAATIGFFDGVHAGHRFLIDELKKISHQYNLPSAVITFEEPPRKVLNKEYNFRSLNTFNEKMEALDKTGIDYCIVLQFTPELSRLTAKEFISTILAKQMHVEVLLIGYDHRFGRNREEGFREYVKYGADNGMKVIKASQYKEDDAKVSSSEIRHLLNHGEVDKAAELLTYPYSIHGKIVEGHKVGRQLGYPTANISIDDPLKIIPKHGIYAVEVKLENGKTYGGMLYIGKRPTLENGLNTTIEVNIFDFEGDLYNQKITVVFVKYIRGDAKFTTLEDLKNSLRQDEEMVKNVLKEAEI